VTVVSLVTVLYRMALGEDLHGPHEVLLTTYITLSVVNLTILVCNTGLILFHIRLYCKGVSTYDFIIARRAIKATKSPDQTKNRSTTKYEVKKSDDAGPNSSAQSIDQSEVILKYSV
jgi:hypothetical protein